MKKIALIGLVSLALYGCGNDKVTKEYLVGDWECKGIRFKSIMEDGKFSDYMDDGNIDYKWSLKLVNNQLYMFNTNSNKWEDINKFIDTYTGEVVFEDLDGAKMQFKGTVEKISEDEFNMEYEMIVNQNDIKHNYLDMKAKAKKTCIRIE